MIDRILIRNKKKLKKKYSYFCNGKGSWRIGWYTDDTELVSDDGDEDDVQKVFINNK